MSLQIWSSEQVIAHGRSCYGAPHEYAVVENPDLSAGENNESQVAELRLVEVWEDTPGADDGWEDGVELTLKDGFGEQEGKVTLKISDVELAFGELRRLREERESLAERASGDSSTDTRL